VFSVLNKSTIVAGYRVAHSDLSVIYVEVPVLWNEAMRNRGVGATAPWLVQLTLKMCGRPFDVVALEVLAAFSQWLSVDQAHEG
jgi:hypothetical protein